MATTSDLALTSTDFLSWLQKKSPANVVQLNRHMQFGRENKYVTVRFDPKRFKTIELVHLTDVHFGHVCCNEPRLNDYLDWILDVPNRFVFLGGDLVDAASKLSVGSPFENKWAPNEQCWRFVEKFLRIRHRVLGYVGGNHERRADSTFGTLGLLIATLLQVPFSSGKQFIDIYFGSWEPYKVSLWHGKGAAQTKGSKAQMLDRFMSEADSHLYLVGHLHDALLLPGWRQVRHRNSIKLEKKYGIMSSAFVEFWNSYGEVMGLSPSDTMMGRIILDSDGHSEVTMR